jgi:hypothetical protein
MPIGRIITTVSTASIPDAEWTVKSDFKLVATLGGKPASGLTCFHEQSGEKELAATRRALITSSRLRRSALGTLNVSPKKKGMPTRNYCFRQWALLPDKLKTSLKQKTPL